MLGGKNLATTTTDANGGFSFPAGAYTCPAPTTPILFTARGGNPGLAVGTNNSAIFLVAMGGPCGQLTPSTFFIINEVTTVAAAYVLRPFLSGINVGVPNSNAVGLANAFSTYKNLVDNGGGTSSGIGIPAGASIPTTTINSLANSIASCVNSADATQASSQNLFNYAGIAPTGTTANVLAATAGIASHPALNAAPIYNLATSTPPFQPTLTSAPTDWALNIIYTSGRLKSIQVALDVDAAGNVFVATEGGFAGTVEELSNNGTLLRSDLLNNTLDGPTDLAIDSNGRVAITSATPGDPSVVLMDNNGNLVSFHNDPSNFKAPSGVAFDASNNLTVTDTGSNKIFQLTPSTGGNPAILTRTVVDSLGPVSPSTDGSGNLWLGKTGPNMIERFAGGIAGTKTSYADANTVPLSAGFSYDNAGNAHICGNGYYLSEYPNVAGPAYSALHPTGHSGGTGHKGMRVDGLGGPWCSLTSGAFNYRLVHATAGLANSFLMSYAASNVNAAGLAIDRSGNVWVASGTANIGLTEVVGAAAPVLTPVSANLASNTFGIRP